VPGLFRSIFEQAAFHPVEGWVSRPDVCRWCPAKAVCFRFDGDRAQVLGAWIICREPDGGFGVDPDWGNPVDRIERLAELSLIVIGTVVLFSALYMLKSIFAPLALALVVGVVLSPLSDFWEKKGYPNVIGALVGLIASLGVLAGLALILQPIVAQLVDQAPKVWSDMQEVIRTVSGLVQGLSDVSEDVSKAIAPASKAAAVAAPGESVAVPTVTDAVLAAPNIVSQIFIFMGVLFFFLLTRTELYSWVALHMSGRGERAQSALKLRRAERHVSRYFVTITLINAGVGIATGLVLEAIGLPGAILWGGVGFLMNFVVYLGPAVYMLALLFAGVATFDGGLALAPAAAFAILNFIEGQFVTPTLIGRHMSVNPLLVFLALIFGIWLWGAIGGFVAIPVLLWLLAINDMVDGPPRTQLAAEAE
jgi:predicted PurR-regulated permease PerM